MEEEIDSTQLENVSKEAVEYFAQEGLQRISIAFSVEKPQKIGAHDLQLKVGSVSIKAAFDENRQLVLQFLKEKLQLNQLSLEVIVEKTIVEQDVKIPTGMKSGAERFKEMLQENPSLILLKEKFNLDVEK